MAKGSWVECSLVDAHHGRLPAVSVVSGEPTNHRVQRYVQTDVGPSVNAAAAGLLGTRRTYTTIRLPMTSEEERRSTNKGCLMVVTLMFLISWIAIAGVPFVLGIIHYQEHDYRNFVPRFGAALLLGLIGLALEVRTTLGRKLRRAPTKVDRYGTFRIYAHPTFVAAVHQRAAVRQRAATQPQATAPTVPSSPLSMPGPGPVPRGPGGVGGPGGLGASPRPPGPLSARRPSDPMR